MYALWVYAHELCLYVLHFVHIVVNITVVYSCNFVEYACPLLVRFGPQFVDFLDGLARCWVLNVHFEIIIYECG